MGYGEKTGNSEPCEALIYFFPLFLLGTWMGKGMLEVGIPLGSPVFFFPYVSKQDWDPCDASGTARALVCVGHWDEPAGSDATIPSQWEAAW